MGHFEDKSPSVESYWRAIILFGQNVASYKFALGKSLLELAEKGQSFVRLEELAIPFATHVAKHVRDADKQGQRPTGPFLDACRLYNREEISLDHLQHVTTRYGFQNVVDAFHFVNGRDVPTRFFEDQRIEKGGLALNDALLALKRSPQYGSLSYEIEARWRLVETAWELNVRRHLLQVRADDENMLFVIDAQLRRKGVTSVRHALNGYQKGKCFYCFRDITVGDRAETAADVDHFFPWSLTQDSTITTNLNGVWNLVLACQNCNRGPQGKWAQIPDVRYLERLNVRNNFLISSHHPLRETLMAQTGATNTERVSFLVSRDREAAERMIHRWHSVDELEAVF